MTDLRKLGPTARARALVNAAIVVAQRCGAIPYRTRKAIVHDLRRADKVIMSISSGPAEWTETDRRRVVNALRDARDMLYDPHSTVETRREMAETLKEYLNWLHAGDERLS